MEFDQNNPVVQLCSKGMELEGQGEPAAAAILFNKAWDTATTDFEKFTAAHYVARRQHSIAEKLVWDEKALAHALNIGDEAIRSTLPSLYLNIGKCYEDLGDAVNARMHYETAFSFAAGSATNDSL